MEGRPHSSYLIVHSTRNFNLKKIKVKYAYDKSAQQSQINNLVIILNLASHHSCLQVMIGPNIESTFIDFVTWCKISHLNGRCSSVMEWKHTHGLFLHVQYHKTNVFFCLQFQAHAVADGSGNAEEPMDIIVNVIDQNDNKPTFEKDTFLGEVAEASPKSTVSESHLSLFKMSVLLKVTFFLLVFNTNKKNVRTSTVCAKLWLNARTCSNTTHTTQGIYNELSLATVTCCNFLRLG